MPGLLDDIFNQIMPGPRKNPYGGLLSDSAWEQYRRDELGRGIGRMGDFLMRAAGGNFSGGQSDAGGGLERMLDIARLQKYTEDRQAKQQRASNYSNLVGGLDPKTGIDWRTGRVQGQAPTTQLASSGAAPGVPPRGLITDTPPPQPELRTGAGLLGFSPAQQGLLREIGPKKGYDILAKQAFDVPSAPTVREFKEGDRVVTKRWNPATRSWVQMGDAPRFKPGERGDLTLAQQANNTEVDQARAALDRMGLDKAEIQRRTQKATNTGRANPDYDPSLERVVRMATQRKTGNDPDYQRYFRTYLGGLEFSEPAGMRPLPPGVSTEQPGMFQRGYDYLFGGDDAAATTGNLLIPRRRPALPGVGNEELARSRPRGPRGRYPARRTGGAKRIETMTEAELSALIYGGRELSQNERDRVWARLDALGVSR